MAGTWLKSTLGFDSGGLLPPGVTVAVNQTGRPARILTDPQWQSLSRLASVGARESTSREPVIQELVVRDVDGALIGRMRVEARGAVHESISTGRGRR